MQIANVYRPGLYTCKPTDSLTAAAQKMETGQVGALAVLDGIRLVGIITERDIVRGVASESYLPAATVSGYHSEHLEVAKVDDDTRDVAQMMLETGVRHVPVARGDAIVGMVSIRDLLAVKTWA